MGKALFRHTHEFEITNFTQYNTEDIGKLIEEAYGRTLGFASIYAYVDDGDESRWQSQESIPTEYIIKDYTGTEAIMVKKPDRMVNKVQTIRIRPHTKLKVGNLEQLAIANSREVPAYLAEAAVNDMTALFKRSWRDADEVIAAGPPPRLRIMPKRRRTISKAERQRVAHEKVVKHVTSMQYRYDGMVILNLKTVSSVDTLSNIRKKGKLPQTKEEVEILRLVNLSVDVSRQLASLLKGWPAALERAASVDDNPTNPTNPKTVK